MYYPKSKIIANQYTAGEELVYLKTSIFYQGYYYVVADGRIYTGKNPNDGISKELEAIPTYKQRNTDNAEVSTLNIQDLTEAEPSKLDYDDIRLKKGIEYPPTSLREPQYIIPTPTYPSFIRYFVKRVNSNVYLEINKETYDNLLSKNNLYNWPAYLPFNLPWTTGGDSREAIYITNRNIVLLTQQRLKLYGFSQYITDYTEFA
jgi:hypothetical protein